MIAETSRLPYPFPLHGSLLILGTYRGILETGFFLNNLVSNLSFMASVCMVFVVLFWRRGREGVSNSFEELTYHLICFMIDPCVQISRNITTNEMANAKRYNYLKGADGKFHNPYDRGFCKNCTEFLLTGYNEDISLPWQPVEQNGGGMIQMSNI